MGPDEICIINLYAMYIPMFIALIVKDKSGSVIKRYVLPILGLSFACSCAILCWVGKGYKQVLGYLAFFAVVMFIGKLFKGKRIEPRFWNKMHKHYRRGTLRRYLLQCMT